MDFHCVSGKRCVSRTSDGPAITARGGSVCRGCVNDIQKAYDQLPHYRDALASFKGGIRGAVGESRVGGSSEPSSPLRVGVLDLINEITAVIGHVEGYAIRDLVTLGGGTEVALNVRRVHSKAENIVGVSRQWERRRVPCPECGLPTLGGWHGEGNIYCTNSECAHTLSKDEYEDWCQEKARR